MNNTWGVRLIVGVRLCEVYQEEVVTVTDKVSKEGVKRLVRSFLGKDLPFLENEAQRAGPPRFDRTWDFLQELGPQVRVFFPDDTNGADVAWILAEGLVGVLLSETTVHGETMAAEAAVHQFATAQIDGKKLPKGVVRRAFAQLDVS